MVMQVTKNTMRVLDSKTDLCDKKKRTEMLRVVLAGLGIPIQCPITSNLTFCRSNEKLLTFSESTQRLLSAFSMATSQSVVKFTIVHDTGESCFEVETEILKIE